MPTRSIVYTGDTGPSAAVEELAQGADLLIAEIMDADRELEKVLAKISDASPELVERADAHFRLDHLSPEEVALLAKRAGVRKLVLTHIALPDEELSGAERRISMIFAGPVIFASDLDRF